MDLRCSNIALLILAVVASVLAACGRGPGEGESPAAIQRKGVISFGPHITETVFALGEGDRLIGVTSFCDYPPEANDLPRVGAVYNPDLEKIAMMTPELLILSGESDSVADLVKKNRIPTLHVYMDSIESISEGIIAIGEALECRDRAGALRDKFEAEIQEIRDAVKGKPRPSVLIITGREEHSLDTLNTVGGTSFVSELAEVAGGDNIYGEELTPYFEASKETIVVKAPEVIIEFHAGEDLSAEEKAQYIADWNKLPSLPAGRNGRIYIVTESYALRPGPRAPLIARKLATLLHPDIEAPAS